VKKVAADDVAGGMTSAAVGENVFRMVRVGSLIGLVRIGRRDPNIVTRLAGQQFTVMSDRPRFEVRGKPVGVIQQKVREVGEISSVRKIRGADEARDDRR
jgi:hypothetical protein